MPIRQLFLASIVALAGLGAAYADDWKVVGVRGEALHSRDGAWISLRLDDVVSDDSPIRTLSNSSVELTRDKEKIEVSSDTQIRISDRKGQRYTTVNDLFGVVAIEANVENVKHFEVKTKFLAAVVKGTIFSVSADSSTSSVVVTRGLVQVTDMVRGKTLDVPAGKSTTIGKTVSGSLKEIPKTGAAAEAAAALAVASAAQPPKDPPGDGPGGKDGKADGKADEAKKDAKDGKDGKAADKTAAEAVDSLKKDGDGKEASPEDVAAGAKEAGIKSGKFTPQEAAQGAEAASTIGEAAKPTIEAPPPEPPKKVVAAPLLTVLLQMDSFSQGVAWTALALIYFGMGLLLNKILGDVGFGTPLNGLISLFGGLIGALVRDNFFFDEDWFNREPYVSIGLITLFSTLSILAACVMRYRALTGPVSSGVRPLAERAKPRERFIR